MPFYLFEQGNSCIFHSQCHSGSLIVASCSRLIYYLLLTRVCIKSMTALMVSCWP